MRAAIRLLSVIGVLGLVLASPLPAHLRAAVSPTKGSIRTQQVATDISPGLGGCPIFPANNVWNTPVGSLPVDAQSNAYIQSIGPATSLHPDFGTSWQDAPIGIPYTVAVSSQPLVNVAFDLYSWSAGESDPGPYPIPTAAPIEGGSSSSGDRHVLVVSQLNCKLYELWQAYPQPDGSWRAGSGAVYDLNSNLLRPDGWTSADAAGLPILPGLVRYDEVQSGEIRHAIRITASVTRKAHIWPARHDASSSTSLSVPPMGQRFRLKASKDISRYPAQIQVIFTAFKRYGMILADNGSNWYVSGAHDPRWDDSMLVDAFSTLHGSDFEAVDESSLMVTVDSGQVREHIWLPLVLR